MNFLTVQQLRDACKQYPYLLLRFHDGYQMGVNTKVAPLARKRRELNEDEETEFVSYEPCDFQTYLSYKHPFLSTQN